jgi:2-polyprenyl-6-methoxyphenol hydroxylase-like FAD-dependent oxidoreductase
LIVGAGLAGLALAIALRQRGVSAAVIERATDRTPAGTGLYLIGAATRALRAVGLGDDLLRKGHVIHTQTVLNHRGKPVAQIDTNTFWHQCGPCLGIPRSELHALLAAMHGDAGIRFGVTVQRLLQHPDGVAVRLSNGTDETYDLVVGADGIRSNIRHLAFGDTAPRFRGQVGWRFITDCPAGIDGWSAYLGAGTAFLILPIGNAQAYCYADQTTPRPIEDPPEGRIERLRKRFRDFARPVREVLAQLDSPERIHFAAIEEVASQHHGEGRVLLVGDAAHAMSPNMACGAAMAFEDALVLADIIGSGHEIATIAVELNRRRAPRISWVQSQTDRRDRARKLPPLLRDAFLRLFWRHLYRSNYQPLLAPP